MFSQCNFTFYAKFSNSEKLDRRVFLRIIELATETGRHVRKQDSRKNVQIVGRKSAPELSGAFYLPIGELIPQE